MNDDLKHIFSNVNEWLKFAEAKLAGIIVLNAGLIVGILQSHQIFDDKIKGLDGYIICAFVLSSLISIFGLIPVLSTKAYLVQKMTDQDFARSKSNINILFYGSIARLNEFQYTEVIKERITNITISPLDVNLINQIVINSEITLKKYGYFKLSAIFTFCGVLAGLIMLLIKSMS